MNHLMPHHAEDLKRSGLSNEMIAEMGCQSLDAASIGRACFGPGRQAPSDGYQIAYPGSTAVRYRLSTAAQAESAKPCRYLSPAGSEHDAYIPPGFDEVSEGSDCLIITEGEKKAAKAVQEGIPCVAIPGVWMWMDPARHTAGAGVTPETPILPRLEDAARGRRVLVLADSDMQRKPDVFKAMETLARAVSHQVYVKACQLEGCPSPAGDQTFGLDDALQVETLRRAIIDTLEGVEGFINPGFRRAVPYAHKRDGGYLHYLIPYHQPGSPVLPAILKQHAQGDGDEVEVVCKPTKAPLASLERTLIVLQRGNDGEYRVHGGDTPAEVVKEVRAITDDRREVTMRLRAEDLVDTEQLSRHGVSGSPAEAKDLWRAQSAARMAGTARVCSDRGWLTVEGARHYIYGEEAITPAGEEPVHPDQGNRRNVQAATGAAGDPGQWMEAFRLLMETNPAQAVISGFAASAATLDLIGDSEPGMIHIFGDSSRGKTTTLQIAASLIGRASRPSDARSYVAGWRSTDNGLERPLQARSGAFLPIDELHAAPKRLSMEETAYMITNGLGKARMSKSGGERERPSWQCQILSTGEISFAERVRQSTKATEINGGLQFRVIDLYAGDIRLVDSSHPGWSDVFGHPIESDAALAESLEGLIAESYGHFWPWHIRRLMGDQGEGAAARYEGWRRAFLDALPSESSAVMQRRTKHAAAAMAGLEAICDFLAIEGETRAATTEGARRFCVDTLMPAGVTRVNGGEAESMLARIAEEIAAQSHRFDRPGIEGKATGGEGRWGWVDDSGALHLTSAGGFINLCQNSGLDPDRARAAVMDAGWIKTRKRWPGTDRPLTVLIAEGIFEPPGPPEPDQPF